MGAIGTALPKEMVGAAGLTTASHTQQGVGTEPCPTQAGGGAKEEKESMGMGVVGKTSGRILTGLGATGGKALSNQALGTQGRRGGGEEGLLLGPALAA